MKEEIVLKRFDKPVTHAIRVAGSQEWHLMNASASLGLRDLWRMYQNSRKLLKAGTRFRQFPDTWGDLSHRMYIQDLHRGLMGVHCDLLCNLLISAFEIVLGKILPNSHYFYMKAAAGTYCSEVDLVETMAEIREDESAETIRKHLDD